jgi:hypothetical protein
LLSSTRDSALVARHFRLQAAIFTLAICTSPDQFVERRTSSVELTGEVTRR